jgi:hypothetical protein
MLKNLSSELNLIRIQTRGPTHAAVTISRTVATSTEGSRQPRLAHGLYDAATDTAEALAERLARET